MTIRSIVGNTGFYTTLCSTKSLSIGPLRGRVDREARILPYRISNSVLFPAKMTAIHLLGFGEDKSDDWSNESGDFSGPDALSDS